MAFVTNVAATLKKTMGSSTQVSTPEETRQRKKTMLGIVDIAISKFQANLEAGKVELDSSIDLERLVRCAMVLSGEASNITGKPVDQTEQQTVETSRVNDLLDENDPMVKALFEKLYHGYNELNDAEGK